MRVTFLKSIFLSLDDKNVERKIEKNTSEFGWFSVFNEVHYNMLLENNWAT